MDGNDVTDLLLQWRSGDRSALDRLIPLVHAELRRMARQCLRSERRGLTLQTTALVNEAYLRLVQSSRVRWQDRAHFFAITARLMRWVLVDEARKRGGRKRGGGWTRVAMDENAAITTQKSVELLVLDRALGDLEQRAPRKARVVEMRFFGGLTIEETAESLGVSVDVVKREWRTARLWLMRALGEDADGGHPLASD